MKKLIIAFILWFCLINQSYGQWDIKVKQWDCLNIKYFNRLANTLLDKQLSNNKIVTLDVYKKAIQNLKKYCNLEKWVPETPSFINQLVDVAFRKIDAIKWMTYWLTPDPLWQWRRDYLNTVSKENNEKPQNIIKKFKQLRWTADKNTKANNTTLYWKYLLVCNEVWNVYQYLLTNSDKNTNLISDIFMDTCQQMVKERYMREVTLVQKITFISFYTDVNKKLFESFSKHTEWQKSFSDKLMKLYDKFTVALWNFQYLVLRFVKVLDANTK